jgi:hypothetical protein
MFLPIDEKTWTCWPIAFAAIAIRVSRRPCTFCALLEPVFEHCKLLLQWLLVELLFALWRRNV